MIPALIRFELVRRAKALSTYVYAAVLFGAGFMMMLASGGVFRSVAVSTGNERVMSNSPHSLFNTISIVALFGLFTVAAVFGQAAYQDFGHGTWMIIFTKNVKKGPYLLGRFLGAFVFAAVLFLVIGFGQALGTGVVALVHGESLGPTMISAYLWPYLTQVWPMLFFTGALFFSLAAVTRSMATVYVGVVVLVLGYLLATTLLNDVQNRTLSGLLDPFGFLAFEVTTRYWTPAERNRDLVSLFGLFGANRLIWTAVGAGLLALAVNRFRTTVDEQKGKGSKSDEVSVGATPFPSATALPSAMGWARASLGLGWIYFREIIRAPVFWALAVSGVTLVSITLAVTKEIFGTPTLPVTWQVLELASGGFGLFVLIILTFYAGELVWRERDVGLADIIDAARVPTGVGFFAKLSALLLVALTVEGLIGVVALISQVTRGFFAIEWRLYGVELLLHGFTGAALICVLALTVQVLVNHKYLGHTAMVVYYIANIALRALGVEDRLLRYGSEPSLMYSDMNGYGAQAWPFFWYRAYSFGFAVILVVVSYAFYVRGREAAFKSRARAGRARLGAGWVSLATLGLLIFAGAGGFIFWNTHVLNRYVTAKDAEREQAAYEKTYKSFENEPQPRIVSSELEVDLYPDLRDLRVGGTYGLINKTAQPVKRVMINLPDNIEVKQLKIGEAGIAAGSDPKKGVYFIDLQPPMQPGQYSKLTFELLLAKRGFGHGRPDPSIVYNGSFFNNFALPRLGYDRDEELVEDGDRKDYGLQPKERMAPRDDPNELQHNYIRKDSDFVTYSATVGTTPDQIAISPGYLEREWMEGGAHYFRYVMDQPILNFVSVLSARYEVRRDEWNGVKLEIYFHPTHTTNLDRMMLGMKDALAYCTDAFGPYQHHQARILEFPRYSTFAQSFPNTIPYSEAIGFIAKVRDDDPDDVDYPYYVTAHEIAHQWWAHQVVGANVRGATMTSESMAQYSALMVVKKKYGKEKMRRFLKFELDRYLVGRATERKKELPLAQNENQQYIHYQKGSLAMYALQDFIGEEKVNAALHAVVDKWKFKGPPYARSVDILDELRKVTPPEYQYLIEDLFETITLYDNHAVSATMKPVADGKWEVSVKVVAKKMRSDEKGNQTELDFDDWMDVGALDEKGDAIVLEKQKVKKGESTLTFVSPRKPAKVGLDPINMLIDRQSDDNTVVPTE